MLTISPKGQGDRTAEQTTLMSNLKFTGKGGDSL